MTATQTRQQQALEEVEGFEEDLRALVAGRTNAPGGTKALVKLADRTLNRLLELDAQHIDLELSDALRAEINVYVLDALRYLKKIRTDRTDADNLAYGRKALLELEATRHILRDGLDHEPLRTFGTAERPQLSRADAVRQLQTWLPRLEKERRAELLGISTKTLSRWATTDDKPATWRAEIATVLVGILQHSWTDEGVYRWFSRPHPQLQNQTPHALLQAETGDAEQQLIAVARGGRAHGAT